MFQKISIILKPSDTTNFGPVVSKLYQWLKRKKKTVIFLSEDRNRLNRILKDASKSINFTDRNNIHKESDLIISLGGDGTLLGLSRLATKHSPPIFGINMGHLGFITEFSKEDIFTELEKALKGLLDIAKISLYKVEIREEDKTVGSGLFFNDAVFNKNDISRMINLSVSTEDEFIYRINGDGLIISSPIGSTAYSLAAGGPVIHPQVQSMAVTPICPHSFTNRPVPLVVPENMNLVIHPQGSKDNLCLTLDGQEFFSINPSQNVRISKSRTKFVKLVKSSSSSYFKTLNQKFSTVSF